MVFKGIARAWERPRPPRNGWMRKLDNEGVEVRYSLDCLVGDQLDEQIVGYLSQLQDEELLIVVDGASRISWDTLHQALEGDQYDGLREVLRLPPITAARPTLESNGSLVDADFAISIGRWRMVEGRTTIPNISGAMLEFDDRVELMSAECYKLLRDVIAFAHRTKEQRIEGFHRSAWASIRRSAIQANAILSDFLFRSVVLEPEKLRLDWARSKHLTEVLEILPTFDGAPEHWLNAFDLHSEVRARYDITTDEGIVQVLVTPKVRTVLEEIKRLPGRRISGRRAEAFLANPYALLGEDAQDVIDEAQFEAAKEEAGINYERFTPTIEPIQTGRPIRIGILVETAASSGPIDSSCHWLSNDQLVQFIDRAKQSVISQHQYISWDGYELEIQGDTPRHIEQLEAALEARRHPELLIKYAQVYDLTAYTSRIQGIGHERLTYSPYIAKKNDDDGWFPENIEVGIATNHEGDAPSDIYPVDSDTLGELRAAIVNAEKCGKSDVRPHWQSDPISIDEAKALVDVLEEAGRQINNGTFEPTASVGNVRSAVRQKHLLLRENFSSVEYREERSSALLAHQESATVPRSMRPNVSLLPHQVTGISWLQHLYRLREAHEVRGAVLADDMGLGKTLQLLALMASILEAEPEVDPMLIVAPVALLENWREEAEKFFDTSALPMLVAYGEALQDIRVPRELVDPRLRAEDGLEKFMKPNWIGKARVVLTTYETLRDYEFGFAMQKWSVMICDEAQKIKNPAAMVTRAAKKQNVQFKIACTGTPVENALVDLWCLFDFVQPGLLGALSEFGQNYSKPIEAKTEEQLQRVEQLRALIKPQILRRIKAEVATELPAKHIVDDCRALPISTAQRTLYIKALLDFKNRHQAGALVPFKSHLGLLQYLRLVCTDPQRYGQTVFAAESTQLYRLKAPKLDWLLNQLHKIQSVKEKAIVFCEFREIQRLLQHHIKAELGVQADIVNGETSALASSAMSRQKRIKAFQASPGFGVIILSPLAVGFGVNIQGANHVIHYTRTWNPAKEDQATDRAYRIGQTKEVFVYYPTVSANDFVTFDVKLDELLSRKRALADDMLNGSGDLNFSDFGLNDVAPGDLAADLDPVIKLDAVHRMEPRYFECFVAALWESQGYTCSLTPASGDNGIDVVAISGAKGVLIQVKSSSSVGARLGWDAVKEVVAGAAYYAGRYPGIQFDKVCVTNRFFNETASANARLNSVIIIDQTDLENLIRQHDVRESDVGRFFTVK